MTLTIRFDRRTCAGFFSCVAVDPEDFEEDRPAAKSVLVGAEEVREGLYETKVPDEARRRAMEAAHVCPVDAIQVLDEEGQVIEGPTRLHADDG